MLRPLTLRTLILIGALYAAHGPALAETSFDAAAVGTGINRSEAFEITDTHAVALGVDTYDDIATEDADSPMNGASGPCFGKLEFREDGAAGDGYCTFNDRAGARFVIRWTVTGRSDGGELEGDWSLIGGAGPWVGSAGGGTFSQTMNPESKAFETRIAGEFTIP
jgi:hypothetical protein